MALEEDESKEVNVPVNATHLRAIADPIPDAQPDAIQGLESLFREHYDRVLRTAYRVTGSIVDAEDVLQTVFLRLSRRQGQGQENVNLDPNPERYLHRAAINASLDLVRQRGRSQAIPIDDFAPVLATNPKLSPEAQRANRELGEVIRRAITKLGTKSAEMFVLKYFEGYDNKEIAGMMRTSAMVVGVLLHRARVRVKKELGDYLEGGQS
jgi:RNA polymerase sigma-70 factor (ECF subfamily)